MNEEKYLIWSNEHNAWWGENHSGYPSNIKHAGRYSFDEAIKICNGANYGWNTDMSGPNELPILERAALALNPASVPNYS